MVEIVIYHVTILKIANLRIVGYTCLFLASDLKLMTTPLPSNTNIVMPIYPKTYEMSNSLMSPGT